MTSFIISSTDKNQRLKKAFSLFENWDIAPIDITLIGIDQEEKSKLSSIGIGTVRKLQQAITFKPFQSSKKSVILDDAEQLTIPAQNALLKILEEPPDHTFIVLLAADVDLLLPTIRSRCKIITLKNKTVSKEKYEQGLNIILNGDIGEKMILAERLSKDKTIALDQLTGFLVAGDQYLRESVEKDDLLKASRLHSSLAQITDCRKIVLTTNVNLRLTLESCFLSLL